MSLVGDKLTVVIRRLADRQPARPATSGRRSRSTTTAFDATAATAADARDPARQARRRRVHALDPRQEAVRAAGRSAGRYGRADAHCAVAEGAVRAVARDALHARHQAPRRRPRSRWPARTIGTGRLSGLGFYVDRHMVLVDVDSGKRNTGFLAPLRLPARHAARCGHAEAAARRSRSARSRAMPMTTPGSTRGDPPGTSVTSAREGLDALEALIRRSVDESPWSQLLAPRVTKRNRIFIGILLAYALGVGVADVPAARRHRPALPRVGRGVAGRDGAAAGRHCRARLARRHAAGRGAASRCSGAVYARRFKADIFGFEKTRVELRAIVVDRAGKVVFDSRGARARRRPLALARRLPGAARASTARAPPPTSKATRTPR